MHQLPNIALTCEHCINTKTLHQCTKIASSPQNCLNNRTMHQYPNIVSAPEYCINSQTLHKYQNIASTPKHCINIRTLHKHSNIASLSHLELLIHEQTDNYTDRQAVIATYKAVIAHKKTLEYGHVNKEKCMKAQTCKIN